MILTTTYPSSTLILKGFLLKEGGGNTSLLSYQIDIYILHLPWAAACMNASALMDSPVCPNLLADGYPAQGPFYDYTPSNPPLH